MRYERRSEVLTHQWTGGAYEHVLTQPDSQRERERERERGRERNTCTLLRFGPQDGRKN